MHQFRFFSLTNRLGKNSGMSLPEVMVSVAITSAVGYLTFGLITDFTKRASEHEVKARALDQLELATKIIKKELPPFIKSVTGPYGEVEPNSPLSPSFWSCIANTSCTMTVNYSHSDINGIPFTTTISPLKVECADIKDSKLAGRGVELNKLARGPLGTSGCLDCPVGKAPQVTVNMYRYDATTGAPSLTGTRTFPQTVGQMSSQGNLAMGLCVNWPSYNFNVWTSSETLMVRRFDKWEITLTPVFSRFAQRGGMTDEDIKSGLLANPSKVIISPSNRLGPELRVTPVQ